MTPRDPLTILVCGVSGVGKTHLINRVLQKIPDAVSLRASAIIGATRDNSDPEYLRALPTDELTRSQELLVRGFLERRCSLAGKRVLLDAHSVIDTGHPTGQVILLEIPTDVIARLEPSGIIHVEDSVKRIAERRNLDAVRSRPARSFEQLDAYQVRSLTICKQYEGALGIPLMRVDSGDEEEFTRAIATLSGPAWPTYGGQR